MECDQCHRQVDTDIEGHSRGQWCDHEMCPQCFVEYSLALRLAIRRKELPPGCPVCGAVAPPGELRERWAEEQWMEVAPEPPLDPCQQRLWPAFVILVALAAALILFGQL